MDEFFKHFTIEKDGTVVRISDGKIMRCCVDSAGYIKLSFRINGKPYQLKVHRIVATMFIPNPDNLPQVNHIDGNKTNNCVENLEWCSAKQNIHHSFKLGMSDNDHLKKSVIQLDMNKNIIARFSSYREASIATGILETNISAVCRKYKPKNRPKARVSAGGFMWETCND